MSSSNKVQPTVSRASVKREEMVRRLERAASRRSGPAQTLDEWKAAGGVVEVLPGVNLEAPRLRPARQSATGGRWAQ